MIEGVDPSPLAELDVGIERDTRPAKPCCKRMRCGGHCLYADGHDGVHACAPVRVLEPNDFGPRKGKR